MENSLFGLDVDALSFIKNVRTMGPKEGIESRRLQVLGRIQA